MKKQSLKNKEIYRIGDKVLSAARLTDVEIDRIVESPDLFSRIRAAAEREETAPAVAAELVTASKIRPLFYVLRWQSAAVAFAVILMFAGAIGLTMDFTPAVTRLTLSVEISPAPESFYTVEPPVTVAAVAVRQKISRPSRPREIARNLKARPSAQPARQVNEIEMGEFQALSYADDSLLKNEGDRIVRVELSRASLYAMGVNIPVENETERVKADLLIGFDGVMKSVRFEKR